MHSFVIVLSRIYVIWTILLTDYFSSPARPPCFDKCLVLGLGESNEDSSDGIRYETAFLWKVFVLPFFVRPYFVHVSDCKQWPLCVSNW